MSGRRIVAVLGATGKQGGSVVRALLTYGYFHVRAVTRDTKKKEALELLELEKGQDSGLELVEADLDDETSLRRAFDGAYGVFGVTNFWEGTDMVKEFHQGLRIADAAKATGVKHLIWSSLEFCYVPHFVSKAMVEDYIKHLGVPYTAVHFPAYFENHLYFPVMKPRKQDDGSYVFALPMSVHSKLPLYSVADSGRFVLEALLHPDFYLGKQMRVATDSLSPRELAAIFEKTTGWKASAEELNHDAFKASFPGAEELYLNMKWFADNPSGLRDVAWSRRVCPEAKDWAGFVQQHLDAFQNLAQ